MEVRGLTIEKGNNVILENVSFSLEPGTFASLVGPSGSGKTSLLRVLALLDNPAAGTVRIAETSWNYDDSGRLPNNGIAYPRLTYVPQTLALWPHLSNRKNITFAMNGKSSFDSMAFEALCERFGIQNILDRYPFEVSQGQRQRVALARAFVLNPRFILLDEPTSALDDETSLEIWNFIAEFVRNGAIGLACTHDKQLAELCDKKLTVKASGIL